MPSTITSQPESISKITKIQDHFRSKIRKGLLVAGERLPSERELARTFGVSLLTVNKAMASLESEMLLERQASRGTYIHSDVSRGEVLVVFSTNHFANPELSGFFQKLLENLSGTVKSHGMRPTHILGYGSTPEKFIQSLEPQSSIWQQAAGVIATGDLGHFEDQLQQKGIPVATLTTIPQQERYSILLDFNALITKAYRHLVNRGCRRIALICNLPIENRVFIPKFKEMTSYYPDLLDRLSAIKFAGAKGPGIAHDCIKGGCKTAIQGHQAMRELWDSDNRPDGVIISDDNTAMGVGQAVLDLSIKTPGQLKLVTQATDGVPRDFPLNYTRYQFDLPRICRGAFGLLHRMMLREREADRLIMKATLRQGSTT